MSLKKYLYPILILTVIWAMVLMLAGCVPDEEEAGKVDTKEIRVELNGEWLFSLKHESGFENPYFDDSDWTKVSVPHTWNVMEELENYDGSAYYRRTFILPEREKDSHLRLKFDATFYKSDVWLNGVKLGTHEGGYTPYVFDITDAANLGGENLIAVKLNNRTDVGTLPAHLFQYGYDWWGYGGIVRDVYILITDKVFIENVKVEADPDLEDSATISVISRIRNTGSTEAVVTLQNSVLDESSGLLVWGPEDDKSLKQTVHIPAGSTVDVEAVTQMPDPKLWHFDHPNLYILSSAVLDKSGKILHDTSDIFGIRKIEIKDAHFYLNGEWVRLVGMTRHEDSPQYGLAENVLIMSSDFDDIKRLNTVFSRPVHYPQHDYIMDYADRNGILLIPEIPAWQLMAGQMMNEKIVQLEKQMIYEMVEKDFNHPSVWAWSLANEIDSLSDMGNEFIQINYEYIKSLDPNRYVSFASNRLYDEATLEKDASKYSDFIMMNEYYGSWAGPDDYTDTQKSRLSQALDSIHKLYPDKMILISEFGFDNQFASSPEIADEMRSELLVNQLDVMRSKDFVGAAIFWIYADYRSPYFNIVMGLVDENRLPRGSYNVIREEYSPVLFDSVSTDRDNFTPEQRVATEVTLRVRGPVQSDMPSYSIEGYALHWEVMDLAQEMSYSKGDVQIPGLVPAQDWIGVIDWVVPKNDSFLLKLIVIRSTGFECIEKIMEFRNGLLLSSVK
ncbi:MAG: beta galactosidase jelly roll domain-containing protein [Candidatus Atribacteria bacterium]|nr:beta galactosidase jelly roll domain-containing protein [Candidatus Atribacteria bacterium]